MPCAKRYASLPRKSGVKERNTAASIRALLLNKARENQQDFSWLLMRYALERLLYRLSVSEYRDSFLLKGALLFDLWFDVPLRPTRDIDLLGFGIVESSELLQVFLEICSVDADDGVVFDLGSLKVDEIRKEANYAGLRLVLTADIGGAKSRVQVDIGYGDAVTPKPEMAAYPVILSESSVPTLRVYPRYTVVAEKLEAIVVLGMVNSRMKDYFDLWVILNDQPLEDQLLKLAFTKTLERRGTPLPAGLPLGLSNTFCLDSQKNKQWGAFVKKNKLKAPSLANVVDFLKERLGFMFASDK